MTPQVIAACAIGRSVELIKSTAVELFLLFYYVQVLGCPAALAGAAMLISLCANAVADPWIGALSDRLAGSRFGRRHTLMLAAIVPGCLAFYLLFNPPRFTSAWMTLAWLATLASASRVLLEFFIAPHITQIVDLTRSTAQRSTLVTVMNLCSYGMSFLILQVAFNWIFAPAPGFPRGQENPAAYPVFASTFAALMALIMLVSAAGTYGEVRARERAAAPDAQPPSGPRPTLRAAWRGAFVGNPNVCAVLLGIAAFSVMSGIARALNLHVGGFLFGLSTTQIKDWNQVTLLATILVVLAARPIVVRFEPKTIYLTGTSVFALSQAIPPLARACGLGSGWTGDETYPWLVTANAVGGLGAGLFSVTALVVTSAVADESEHRTGVARHALLFGFMGLAGKFGAGVSSLVAGGILDLVGFPRGATGAAAVPETVMRELGLALGLALIAALCAGLYAFRGYRLTARAHQAIGAELERRST